LSGTTSFGVFYVFCTIRANLLKGNIHLYWVHKITYIGKRDQIYGASQKTTTPSPFVHISAVRANFWMEFYTTIKQ